MEHKVGDIWRRKGPLGAVLLRNKFPDGWVIEVFDYHIEWNSDALCYEETERRVNRRHYFVPGDDPLISFDKEFLRKIGNLMEVQAA